MQARSVLRLSPLLVALAFGVVPVLFASTQGCSSTPDAETGSAEFVATTAQELSAADVTRVRITITGAGIATPITQDLVRVSGQWRGTVGAIPVGADRNFHGEAYDGSGAIVYQGDVPSVTILRGATALVSLLMQQSQGSTPFHNAAPRVDTTTASSNAVAPGDAVSLAATVHDPDGEPLTISWSATGGTFTSASSLSPQWTAPSAEGSYVLTMRATDPKGAVAATTFTVNVATSNGRGSAAVTTTLNTWPEIALVNASPTRIDVGESTTLSVVASDADNDALHYAWGATCAGSFDNDTSQAPTFTLAAPLPAGNACALVATVTDGRGGTNTGQIGITTGPGVLAGLAPVIDTVFQSSTAPAGGETLTLRVRAHDPEGRPIAFVWNDDAGLAAQGLLTVTTSGDTSEAVWTPPRCGAVHAAITATVTDENGQSTIQPFVVDSGLPGARYDAFADFSSTSNPAGPWSYGQQPPGGAFAPYTARLNIAAGLSWWAAGPTDPNVVKNTTGADVLLSGVIIFPARDYVHIHPGPSGQRSVVRFTAPAESRCSFDGAFRSLRVGGANTTTDVHVLQSGIPRFDASIDSNADVRPFLLSLDVHNGETVDFAVGVGTNGNYANDSTGVRAAIACEVCTP